MIMDIINLLKEHWFGNIIMYHKKNNLIYGIDITDKYFMFKLLKESELGSLIKFCFIVMPIIIIMYLLIGKWYAAFICIIPLTISYNSYCKIKILKHFKYHDNTSKKS